MTLEELRGLLREKGPSFDGARALAALLARPRTARDKI